MQIQLNDFFPFESGKKRGFFIFQKLRFSFIGVLLLLQIQVFGQTPTPQTCADLLEASKELMKADAFDKALAKAKQAQQMGEQLNPPIDTLIAKAYQCQGRAYIKLEEYKRALESFQKAGTLLEQLSPIDSLMLAENYQSQSLANYYIGDHRSSIDLSSAAQQLLVNKLGALDTLVAETYLYIGEGHFYLEDYEEAITNYLKEGEIYRQLDNVTPTLLANNYNNIGLCHEYRGDYQKAFDFYQRSIPIYKNAKNDKNAQENLASTYNNLAICYSRMGNYQKALSYFEYTLEAEKKIFKKENLSIASTYTNIGLIYKLMGKYELAKDLLLRALDIRLSKEDKNIYRMARLYGNLGIVYLEAGDYQKALEYCEKDLLLKLQKTDPNDNVVTAPLVNVGKCYQALGNYEKARRYFEQALAIRQRVLPPYDYKTVKVQVELANLDTKIGDEGAAIVRMRNIIPEILGGKAIDDFKAIAQPLRYLDVLYQKGDAHYQLYQKTKQQIQLKKALEMYHPAINLVDFLRTGLDEEASKEVLLRQNYNLYGKTLDVLYQLWDATRDSSYIHRAFDVAEKGKSTLLLEAVQTTHAKDFAGIDAPLLEKERALKVDIAFLEKRKFEAEEDQDTAQINTLRKALFDAKLEYEQLVQRIEKEFPAYYQLKYNTQNAAVQEVQDHLLDAQTSMINYFIGEKDFFVFVINDKDIHFYKATLPADFSEIIKTFIESIAQYPLVAEQDKERFEETYVSHAYQLYQTLVQPFENGLREKLIIVPHNLLGYVPFECLLKKLPEQNFAFRSHAYLLHDYQMSYTYSASLLDEMKQGGTQRAPKTFVGFAPKFSARPSPNPLRRVENRYNNLGALTMNIPEVKMIQDMLQGDVFVENDATESNFVANAQNYQIIHLATHGIANDQAGDFCYLAFSEQKDSIENEILYAKELYPLRLNADMVVLSACETATGQLKKGEGIVSLARGFSYAGAKSILTTLWSINDMTTARIMEYFYQNIRDGQTKDAALQTAQRTFLQKSRDQIAHPVYWGAFIPVGNMEAIRFQHHYGLWWAWGTLALIVGLGYWRLRKAK